MKIWHHQNVSLKPGFLGWLWHTVCLRLPQHVQGRRSCSLCSPRRWVGLDLCTFITEFDCHWQSPIYEGWFSSWPWTAWSIWKYIRCAVLMYYMIWFCYLAAKRTPPRILHQVLCLKHRRSHQRSPRRKIQRAWTKFTTLFSTASSGR